MHSLIRCVYNVVYIMCGVEQRPGNSNHWEIIPYGRTAPLCRLTHMHNFAPSERNDFLQWPHVHLWCQVSEAHITIPLCGFATISLSVGFSMLGCSHTKVMVMERVWWSFQTSLHCGSVVGARLSVKGSSGWYTPCRVLPGLCAHNRHVVAQVQGQAWADTACPSRRLVGIYPVLH